MHLPALPGTAGRFDIRRRTFLKAGIAGSVLLLAGRWLPTAWAAAADAPALRYLGSADVVVLRRVIPIMLAGALPDAAGQRATALEEVVQGIDLGIHYQPPAVRAEIAELFGLLTGTVTRALVAGVWSSWDKASTEDVQEFLAGWRDSRFALLRSGYLGLNQLIVGSWYSNPRSWARIGYGGPPKLG